MSAHESDAYKNAKIKRLQTEYADLLGVAAGYAKRGADWECKAETARVARDQALKERDEARRERDKWKADYQENLGRGDDASAELVELRDTFREYRKQVNAALGMAQHFPGLSVEEDIKILTDNVEVQIGESDE